MEVWMKFYFTRDFGLPKPTKDQREYTYEMPAEWCVTQAGRALMQELTVTDTDEPLPDTLHAARFGTTIRIVTRCRRTAHALNYRITTEWSDGSCRR